MRSHWFKLKGVPATSPPGPGALLNFELGRMWEEPVEKALRHAGVPFMSQLKLVDEELGVGGTIDIAVLDGDEWELVSIKTEGIGKERYRRREGKNFYQANPEYAIQEACYKHLMEVNGYKVKDTARYLVITKDNGKLDEPIMKFSDKLMEKTLERIKTLRLALDSDTMPPCECEGWKIGYCQYGDLDSQETNSTGKLVSTKCCMEGLYENNPRPDN